METRARRRLVAGAVALALAALGTTVLAGCGGGDPATVEVTPAAQTGTTVEASVGDTVVVSLDANATTGYEWAFVAGDTFTIESSEYVPDPNPSGLSGSGGTQVVKLKVTKAGSSELTGTYARSWETPAPDAKPDFTMTVTGQE